MLRHSKRASIGEKAVPLFGMSGILKRCHLPNVNSKAKDEEKCLVRNGHGQTCGLERKKLKAT